MSRRCRPRSDTGLIVSALVGVLALIPVQGNAQTAVSDSGVDLLQPSLQGNPDNPAKFVPRRTTVTADQAPPTGQFTAPSRIGGTPVYGSPTGFGAGDTGFDSSNRTRRKRQAQVPKTGTAIAPAPETTFDPVTPPPLQVPSRPPLMAAPPPAVVYPSRAASRPGAILPPPPDQLPISNPPAEVHPASAASRPGAVLALPPPIDVSDPASTPPIGTPVLNTLPPGTPSRPLPIAGPDPYEALGIKAGSFLILPSLDIAGGYDSNPQHVPNGPGSSTLVVSPELQVRSDWSRHAFSADVLGSYYWYGNDGAFSPPLNRPYLNSRLDGRIDVTRQTQILLENRVIVTTDNPGSPNIQAGLAKLPIDTTVGGTVGVAQQLSRFDVSLKGTFDRTVYQNSELTDGESTSNFDRNFDQTAGILRVGYAIDPGVKPFVEGSADTRRYNSTIDAFGEDRNSDGISGKVGATVNIIGTLTGELAAGYLSRDYHDPLPNISGPTLDGSLIWQATALTTAKFTAASSVSESNQQGVSGTFSRDVAVQVDHAFRLWLIGTFKAGYGRDDYVGEDRKDNRYFTSLGLTYKMNRMIQLRGEVREDWLTSNTSGVAYQATSGLIGIRLQR